MPPYISIFLHAKVVAYRCALMASTILLGSILEQSPALGCDSSEDGDSCVCHSHDHHGNSKADSRAGHHDHLPHSEHSVSFVSRPHVAATTHSARFKFAVVGDTQNSEFGGRSNILTRLVESINAHDVDYVLFPGDLVGDTGVSGWQAWAERTSAFGTNSAGVDKRLMNPGNHDRGAGGDFAAWQSTFDWLPDSQIVGGQQGIDQVDYYVDHENVRFVSISTDAPSQIYNGRVVNQAPPALDWMREVMQDVDSRNSDADSSNDIDHVFTFSHRPVTTQFESPTGGTNGAFWESMTGLDPLSGNHAATAFLPGHWHMYQPSRPDPRVDTMEIISGTGGGGLEGQAHRNRHGYSIITVDGSTVTSDFYGDFNQSSDNWDFELLDSFVITQPGGAGAGELAFYDFESGASTVDSSASSLSKSHALNYHGVAQVVNQAPRGDVLLLTGDGTSYVDAKNIGDNNLAVLGDLSISLSARVDSLGVGNGDNTLVAFGSAHGSANGSLNSQESANYAYKLAMTMAGNLQFSWQHDDAEWEVITSTEIVADPFAWHDYEVRRDSDSMGVAFFVDGAQLGDALEFDSLPTGGGSGSLFIGADAGGALDFHGWIDAVRISSESVSVVPIILGDFDGNGSVDSNDWLIFAAGIGTDSPGATDIDGDGVNGFLDFLMFQEIFAEHNGPEALRALVQEVPEPTSLTLATTLTFLLVFRPVTYMRAG